MKYLLLIFVMFAFGILIKPFFHPGYPATHDGENHLARIANYALAFKQGQIPPRWAPSFWSGYGYPVFNYNYPLANIVAAPLLAVHLPVETTLKVIEIFALLIGAVGVYLFLRDELGKESAYIGVLGYLTAPFLFSNIYVRGAVGEVMAYAVFPHVLAAIDRCIKSRDNRAALYLFINTLALMLAHNIFVLTLIPLVALYLLYKLWKKSRGEVVFVVGTFVAGVLASMFFWLPALLEKSLVSIDSSSLISDSVNHFPTFSQLLTSPFSYGYSYTSPIDGLSFNLGLIFLVSALFLLLAVGYKRIILTNLQAAILLLFFTCIFLMLPSSLFIWNLVPVLKYLQFPWRFLFLTSLLGSYILALFYSRLQGKQKWWVIIALLISMAAMSNKSVTEYIHHDDTYYISYTQTSTVLDENKPKTLTLVPGELAAQAPKMGDGTYEVQKWNGSYHRYIVHANAQQYITEPTAYFPGWQVRVDAKLVPIEFERAGGRISFIVPAGDHTIETKFTQNTPSRLIGNTISLFACLGFILYFFSTGRQHNRFKASGVRTSLGIRHEKNGRAGR